MRYCKIIAVMLVLVALCGCRSHRNVTSHEEARWQRAVLDSTATRVDSMERRDSVSLWWAARGLSLEVDSVDWHFTWDSAGRVASVSGKRLVSRRSSKQETQDIASVQKSSREEARYQRAIQDSAAALCVQDKHVETQAGWHPSWLELVCCGVVLVLAIGGAIHLRELTERWSKRR